MQASLVIISPYKVHSSKSQIPIFAVIVCSIATFSNKLAGCLMLTLPMISLLWNVCVVKRVYEILYLLWSAWMRKRAKGRLAKYYP